MTHDRKRPTDDEIRAWSERALQAYQNEEEEILNPNPHGPRWQLKPEFIEEALDELEASDAAANNLANILASLVHRVRAEGVGTSWAILHDADVALEAARKAGLA